jgi:hypothetical protein
VQEGVKNIGFVFAHVIADVNVCMVTSSHVGTVRCSDAVIPNRVGVALWSSHRGRWRLQGSFLNSREVGEKALEWSSKLEGVGALICFLGKCSRNDDRRECWVRLGCGCGPGLASPMTLFGMAKVEKYGQGLCCADDPKDSAETQHVGSWQI